MTKKDKLMILSIFNKFGYFMPKYWKNFGIDNRLRPYATYVNARIKSTSPTTYIDYIKTIMKNIPPKGPFTEEEKLFLMPLIYGQDD